MKAELLSSRTTRQLIDLVILTGLQIDAGHPDSNLYTVRGWLLDELESRNPEAYEAFLESDCWDDADLFRFFPC